VAGLSGRSNDDSRVAGIDAAALFLGGRDGSQHRHGVASFALLKQLVAGFNSSTPNDPPQTYTFKVHRSPPY